MPPCTNTSQPLAADAPSSTTMISASDNATKSTLVDKPSEAPSKALDFRNATEWLHFLFGVIFLVCVGPFVGAVVFAAMIWEANDRLWDGGFVDSGKELTGFIFAKFIPWLTKSTQAFNEQFVKRADDAYMMNCIFGYGFVVPVLFFSCAYFAYFSESKMTPLWVAFVYHLIRIGPYFMNFAYVYTLCHKEGHSRAGLFSKGYNDSLFLRNVFNWWIGMFYGVLPATFAYGHSINHHRYNNGELDVITTSDKPRDNFANWVAYLPRYVLYAVNVSTIQQFVKEKNYKVASKVLLGTVWFLGWLCLVGKVISPMFALVYVSFPFFEASLLLAAVNWSWHAFLDPRDPSNEYVQSITIIDGCINVLNEDAHVVHHQYPGAHWTQHPGHQSKHWEAYADNRASAFRRTHAFEVFGMVVARDYNALARKFVDLKGDRDGCTMSHAEKVELMKERTRGVWWGPRLAEQQARINASPSTSRKKEASGEEKKEE